MGRSLAAAVRSLAQVIVVYILALLLKIELWLSPFAILGVILICLLYAALFSTFSLIVACIVKKRERFMGIGQTIIMPLFFASNALYPLEHMPNWIRTLSVLNPLTYQVDALRTLMIPAYPGHFPLSTDFAYGILLYVALLLIGTRFYPRILY